MRKAVLLAVLLAGCAAAQRPSAGVEGPALASREVLARFTSAVDEGRWPEAWALLSARWRARETPERLAADLAASGPVGTSAVARAKAALAMGALPEVNGRSAALAVGQGKAAILLLEDGSWQVDALE